MVTFTGRVAVYAVKRDNSREWKLGYSNIDLNRPGYIPWSQSWYAGKSWQSYFVHRSQVTHKIAYPPDTLDGYTLSLGYVWAYCKLQMVWYEMLRSDADSIPIGNTDDSGSNYNQSSQLQFLTAQWNNPIDNVNVNWDKVTDNSGNSDGNSAYGFGVVDVHTIPSTTANYWYWYPDNNGGMLGYFDSTLSVSASFVFKGAQYIPVYQTQRFTKDGVAIQSYRPKTYCSGVFSNNGSDSNWAVYEWLRQHSSYDGHYLDGAMIDKKQILQQPFKAGDGTLWYRPTTVEVILGFEDIVVTDGYNYVGPNQVKSLFTSSSAGPPIEYARSTRTDNMYFNIVKGVWHKLTDDNNKLTANKNRIYAMNNTDPPAYNLPSLPNIGVCNRSDVATRMTPTSTRNTDIEVAWHRIPKQPTGPIGSVIANVANGVWVYNYANSALEPFNPDLLIYGTKYDGFTCSWYATTVFLLLQSIYGNLNPVTPIVYAIQTTDTQRSVYWKYFTGADNISVPGGVDTGVTQFAYVFSNTDTTSNPPNIPPTGQYWIYHMSKNIWIQVSEPNYVAVVYAQRNVQIAIDNRPDLTSMTYIQRSAVDNRKITFTDGNYELVKERAPPGSGTPTGNNLVVWLPNATSGQWVSIDPNSLVAGHWEASSTPWYFYRASDLYNICMYYNSANVVVTGHVAVSVSNTDGSRTWRHGILFPYSFASNRFLSTLKNTGITDPPNPLDGYTLQSDYRWAYNLDQQIWYEISTDSYTDVTISGTTGSITYESDSPLPLLPKLNTMVDGTSSASSGAIEIIWSRTPENATVPATSLNWFMLTVLGQAADTYGKAATLTVAAYNSSRTNAAGLQVWDVANSCWKAIDRLQVICEPFTSGNTVKWRPNLPMEILNRLISNGLSAPVTYTGNAILPGVKPGTSGAAPQWCTGRTFLGTDNQPSNFSYIMGNYNNSGSILIQGPPSAPTSNIGWAFHQRQRIWCDIANEESYARIQLWNLSSNADGLNLYYIADTPVSSVYIQKTVANNGGTSTTEGNVEVLWYRSGNYVAPLPESLRFMDQTSGVSTDDTGTVFSSTKAAINAYQTNRTRQSIRTVWSSNAQDWRVLDVDQVLWEPFTSGNVTKWRMNTLDNIRMNATTRPIGDPVNYTGYVAVLSTDFADQVQWRLGRSYLDNVATPANFSVVLPNYPQPISQAGKPTTIIPITLEFPPSSNIQSDTSEVGSLPSGYYHVYHVKQLVWHQIDEDSFVRVMQTNTITNLNYQTTEVMPSMYRQNSVSTDNTKLMNTGVELSFQRAGRSDTEPVASSPFIEGLSYTFTSEPSKAFGRWYSLLAYQGQASSSNGMVAWFYTHGKWIAFHKNQIFSEPFIDTDKSVKWRANSLYQIWKTIFLSDPVVSTGKIAIPVDRGDGIYIWRLGRSNIDFGRAGNYALTITNLDDSRVDRQIPTPVLNGYQTTGIWAYHIQKKMWCEMVRDSYKTIQLADLSAPLDYNYSVMPTWTLQSKVISGENNYAATGNIQVVWGLPGQPSTTQRMQQALWIDGSTLFLNVEYPGSAFINEVPNLANGVFYTDGTNFRVMHIDQIIVEPFRNEAGLVMWRVTTPQQMIAQTIIFHTGYAAVFTIGPDGLKQWRLGRSGLPSLGKWGVVALFPCDITNQDPNGLIEVQRPPNTIEGYTLAKDRLWVYHSRHLVWYETNLLGWQLINRINAGIFAQITYSINKTKPSNVLPLCNSTIVMDPKAGKQLGGNVEVNYSVRNQIPPSVLTLNYSQSGVLSTQYVHPKYGQLQSSELIPIWNYTEQKWISVLRNEIILEPTQIGGVFNGWSPTIAVSVLERGYSIVDPVNYNMVAVLHFSPDGSKSWLLGRLSIGGYLGKRAPSDFAATLNNLDPNGPIEVQAPPSTIGDYTLGTNNAWAFHLAYKIWVEVDSVSWNRITLYGNRGDISYKSTLQDFPLNNTRFENQNLQYQQALEIIPSRVPDIVPMDPTSLPYCGTMTPFKSYNHPLYGISSNPLAVWNQSAWNAIGKDAIVQVYLPDQSVRFVVAYAYAMDGLKNDIQLKLQAIQKQPLVSIQNLLTTGTNLNNDLESKLKVISSWLDQSDEEMTSDAVATSGTNLASISQLFTDTTDQITAIQKALSSISYTSTSFDQLLILWKTVVALEINTVIQIQNARISFSNITASNKLVLDLYAKILAGELVPLAMIKSTLNDDLNRVVLFVNALSKSISLVSIFVQSAPVEQKKVTTDLDPSMPQTALDALNEINSIFADMKAEFNEANTKLEGFKTAVVQAKDDIPALIPIQMDILNFLSTSNNIENQANEIITQFQRIRDCNTQLSDYGVSLISQNQNILNLVLAGIKSIQAINNQLTILAKQVEGLLSSLSDLNSPENIASLKTIESLVIKYQTSGSQYVAQLSAQATWNHNTTTDISQILTINKMLLVLQADQVKYFNLMQGYLQDMQTRFNSTVLAMYTPMCQSIANATQTISGNISQFKIYQAQIATYQDRANQALAKQNLPAIRQAITTIGLYMSYVTNYLSESQTYLTRCQAIYSTLDKTNFSAINSGYLEVQDILKTLTQNLSNANGYVKQAAIQTSIATGPPDVSTWSSFTSWVTSLFNKN